MPTSQPRTLTTVWTLIQSLAPGSLIDLGVGHGKNGVLAREYLEIMKTNYAPETWKTRLYGIEVFADYHNPLWDYAYDSVVIADALDGLKALPEVDLIVALDIWEHFEVDYAQKVLDLCLNKARFLMISTPMNPRAQGAVLGNSAETHVSRWGPSDFSQVPHLMATCATDDWIILLSRRDQIPRKLVKFSKPTVTIRNALRVAFSLWSARRYNR
jgi:hypothetical protein